jgi:predicted DCC family thiol-disulfide oxidoreductase YuxK
MSEPNPVQNTALIPILIFDGDCAFCTRSVQWARRWIGRLPAIAPWQQADLPALGLTPEQCEIAVQFVDRRGRINSGEIAVARLLIFAGKGWQILGRLMLLPGIKQICGLLYRWVARNRHRLPGGTAACALPNVQSDRSDGESP